VGALGLSFGCWSRTHGNLVPLKTKIRHPILSHTFCAICREPVSLESAKVDEDGRTIHEDCYPDKVSNAKKPPASAKKE
jgi:hypothetical protein